MSRDGLWLPSPRSRLTVEPALKTAPVGQEILVRVRTTAVNPVDGLNPVTRRVVLPWLRNPVVLGSDVAGEVVDGFPGVTRFHVGDRVLGHAVGARGPATGPPPSRAGTDSADKLALLGAAEGEGTPVVVGVSKNPM